MFLQQPFQNELGRTKVSLKHNFLQEVHASFLGMSKIEFFFLGASVGIVPMVSRLVTLLVSSSQCLHLVSILASKLL
jgi:hypothetical protein